MIINESTQSSNRSCDSGTWKLCSIPVLLCLLLITYKCKLDSSWQKTIKFQRFSPWKCLNYFLEEKNQVKSCQLLDNAIFIYIDAEEATCLIIEQEINFNFAKKLSSLLILHCCDWYIQLGTICWQNFQDVHFNYMQIIFWSIRAISIEVVKWFSSKA